MTNPLLKLAERVEAATAEQQASVLLEAWDAVFGPRQKVADDNGEWLERRIRFEGMLKWRAFESAAMSLVPEQGKPWGVYHFSGSCMAFAETAVGRASTPALALCAAALRARAAS